MPYCPKCDMEFVDGITVCSDCKGPLVESAEEARAMKKAEEETRKREEFLRRYEEQNKAIASQAEQNSLENFLPESDIGSESETNPAESMKNFGEAYAASKIYVKKEQRYEDLKSSAFAFLIMGVVLLAGSLLCWTGIIRLPFTDTSKIITQSVLTLIGLGSLFVSISSSKSAKTMQSGIDEENKKTRELIRWFLETYRKEALDNQILAKDSELTEGELSLKRFELIQDYLITNHDLPDQSYVELLSEEIYSKMFE